MKVKNLLAVLGCIILINAVIFGVLYYGAQKPLQTVAPVQIEATPRFLYSIYEGQTNLVRPLGIAKDKDGLIYISNNDGQTVEVFARDWKSLRSIGGQGVQPGKFLYPYGIGILPNGNLLVAETGNFRVQELTPEGQYVKTILGPKNKWGLGKPGPICIDSQGNIYIGDISGSQVLVLGQDGKLRHRIRNISYPHGIAVDEKNKRLYISDAGDQQVKVFALNSLEKGPLAAIGTYLPGQRFTMVRGLAVDNLGRLYVADTINNAIRVFDKNGTYLFSFGRQGFGDGEFLYPNQILVDGEGKIFISDWGNNRVEVWGY